MLTAEHYYDVFAARERLLEEGHSSERHTRPAERHSSYSAELRERYVRQAANLGLLPAPIAAPAASPPPSARTRPAAASAWAATVLSSSSAPRSSRPAVASAGQSARLAAGVRTAPPAYGSGRPSRRRPSPAGREPARVAGPSTSAAAAAAAAAAVLAVMERVLYDSDEGKGRSGPGPGSRSNRRGKRSVGSGSGSDSQAASTSSDPVQYGGRRDEGGGGLLSSDDGGSSGSSSPRLEGREVLYARELLRIAAGGRAQAGGGGGARRGGGGGDQLRAAVADSGLGRQQEPTAAFLRTWRDRKKREALRKQVVRFLVRTPGELDEQGEEASQEPPPPEQQQQQQVQFQKQQHQQLQEHQQQLQQQQHQQLHLQQPQQQQPQEQQLQHQDWPGFTGPQQQPYALAAPPPFPPLPPAPARPPWLPRPEDHRSYSYAVYGGGPAVQYVPPPYSVHGMGPYGVYPGVVPLHGMYGAVQATPYGAHGSVATQTSPRSGGGAPVPQSPQPPQAAVSGPADAFSFDSPAAAAARQSPSPPRTGGGLGSSAGGDAAAAAGLARPSVPLSIEIPDTPPPPKSPAAPAPASSPRGPPAGHSHSSSGGGATAPLSQLTLSGWTAAAALPPPPPPSSPGLPPSASPTRSAPPSDYSGLREQQSAMSRDVGALLSRLADMRGRLGGGDDEGAKAGEGRGV